MSITFARHGDPAGPAVLLLHPWFASGRVWDYALPVLAGCDVLVPDLLSPALHEWREVANPDGLAAGVRDILDSHGARAWRVAGNSMGGILAQLLAIEQPDRFSHVLLIGTGARSAGLHSAFRDLLLRWLDARDPADLVRLTRSTVAPRAARDPVIEACIEAVEAVDPDYIAAIPRSTLDLDLRSRLGRVRARALVLRGTEDAIRTEAQGRELAACITGARYVEIPGAGHTPMVDSPEAFSRLLTSFFEL